MTTVTETMTSRERVRCALNHEPVDRMPIDLGSHYSTGISAFAYWNLREHLGLSTDHIEIVDPNQFLARVDDDVLERFHCDVKILQPAWVETHRWQPRKPFEFTVPSTMRPVLDDEGGWIIDNGTQLGKAYMPRGGFFFDGGWPSFETRSTDEILEAVAIEAERLYKDSDYAAIYLAPYPCFVGDINWCVEAF